ncbi:hypothetical protein PLICRDRAFT_367254 [Plicaturopsis crispa FD-325 SS-3]|uniref:Uncharacterized protein n=1 Tax=Plicaturopsis crispa FD-325 SS-3 TaxID=944288 RepID=A0A0C9SWZ7_PLICR|nr:hypothetical protein PLICRDRAFT_367254 [Plicaturopsis crispa FD-325 SS-3]
MSTGGRNFAKHSSAGLFTGFNAPRHRCDQVSHFLKRKRGCRNYSGLYSLFFLTTLLSSSLLAQQHNDIRLEARNFMILFSPFCPYPSSLRRTPRCPIHRCQATSATHCADCDRWRHGQALAAGSIPGSSPSFEGVGQGDGDFSPSR